VSIVAVEQRPGNAIAKLLAAAVFHDVGSTDILTDQGGGKRRDGMCDSS
jgi:hypothetical protein